MDDSTTVYPDVLEDWSKEIESLYLDGSDRVLEEWRRTKIKTVLVKIYKVGIKDGELITYAKRSV